MQPDLTPIEARFKQILFMGLEEIQATKGALYLLDEEKFKLVTQYGHKQTIRREIESSDELVRHFKFQRMPLLINAAEEDRRFTARMLAEDSTRMVVVPVYSHGRLTALLELRDKAGKKLFGQPDVDQAQRIVDRLLQLYTEWDLFEHQSLQSPEGERQLKDPQDDYRNVAKIVAGANESIARGVLQGEEEALPFGDAHFAAAGAILAAIVALPGAVAAAFTTNGKQVISSRSTLIDNALIELERRIQEWFRQKNETVRPGIPVFQYPFGTTTPIEATQIASTITAQVKTPPTSSKGFLTIAFETAPAQEVMRFAEAFLRQMSDLLSIASSWQQLHNMRKAIAESLLQPPSQQYQTLAAHSYRVAGLAEQLGRSVRLTVGELENLKLSSMLHDVGMRLINYQRLYRKPQPTDEELRLMRAHNAVGAVVIANSPLGKQIARDVYQHHDRYDQTKDRNVAVGPRIIHICEAFDAMTSPDSYKAPKPVTAALDIISSEAGRQFDPELAKAFVSIVR